MKTICTMRNIFKAMASFEDSFEKTYQTTVNEAMIMCALRESTDDEKTTASYLARQTQLTPSHTSKLLRILEEKGLIIRSLSDIDRRQMHFQLSDSGMKRIEEFKLDKVKIPEILKPLFD